MYAGVQTEPAAGIEGFIKQKEEKDLLRLSTAGSVDDGKSTRRFSGQAGASKVCA